MAVVAIDIAILVPPLLAARAMDINRTLAGDRPDALRLDETHLPHVTLAQQFVEGERLDELFAELDRILRHEPARRLSISGAVSDHGTVMLAVHTTPDLQTLHEQVMDAIEPFESPDGTAGAFRADGESIREKDVDWVRYYRERSAYVHFRPHITVGHGDAAPAVQPARFRADRIAVCHLGRFCTCRRVLRAWSLGTEPA